VSMDLQRTAMPEGWEPAVAYDRCFDAQYGLEVVDEDVAGAGVLRGRVAVHDALLGRFGTVTSGVFASVAEALASRGTALAVMPEGRAAMGMSNDTTVLEPVSEGALHAEARLHARIEGAWVWTVDVRDDAGRPCALSRVTVAVRP
jgi:1,4-dihydroxy-2-naphthoyl-CoA hydrolase